MSLPLLPIRLDRALLQEQRHILFIAAALALLLSLPMMSSGLFLDDFEQRIKLLSGDTSNIFQTFRYGDPFTDQLIQSGILPWWTHEATKTNFFRPLAEVFLRLDYALWPDNFALMHLHSALWYAVLALIAGLAYRAVLPVAWAAGLAALFFALDGYHAGAVVWLCNRNVLISMSAALLCLLCHRQSAADKSGAWRILAAALFALGLSSGESALAISGYLLAHEVFLSRDTWFKRLLRLLPYGLIGLGYLAWWHHAGYGTDGPGFYTDPGRDPLFFLQEVAFRAPAYLVSQLTLLPAEIFSALESPTLRTHALLPGLLYALGLLALLAWFFWPLLRRSAEARFFTLGMLIAVLPICGVSMVSRVLWYVGFGASGLLALFIQHYRDNPNNPDHPDNSTMRRGSRFFVGLMLLLHLWLSPLFYLVSIAGFNFMNQQWDTQTVQLPNAGPGERRLLVLATKNHWIDITFPILKDRALSLGQQPSRPPPAITRILALTEGEGRYRLERPAENVLHLQTPDDQPFITLRPVPWRFAVGETVHRPDVDIEVLAVSPQGAPTRIEYRFAPGALSRLDVMTWQKTHFTASTLPAIGQSQELLVE